MIVYIAIRHDGTSERLVVEDGLVKYGPNRGSVFENIKGMYAQTLRLTVGNRTAMEETRAKHARILAGIADEVSRA